MSSLSAFKDWLDTGGGSNSSADIQQQQSDATAQGDSNAANAFGSPPVADTPVQADPAPVVLADNTMPPAHDDPLVGQNKPIDPNDKGAGLIFEWDEKKGPRLKGGYLDPPNVGPLKPGGDPLKYPQDQDDTPSGGGGPKFGGPPPGSTPPGPGYKWDPILQGWRRDKVPDPAPSNPAPQPDPRGPGDYEVPGGDSAVV
jgi:hypothetical protein